MKISSIQKANQLFLNTPKRNCSFLAVDDIIIQWLAYWTIHRQTNSVSQVAEWSTYELVICAYSDFRRQQLRMCDTVWMLPVIHVIVRLTPFLSTYAIVVLSCLELVQ